MSARSLAVGACWDLPGASGAACLDATVSEVQERCRHRVQRIAHNAKLAAASLATAQDLDKALQQARCLNAFQEQGHPGQNGFRFNGDGCFTEVLRIHFVSDPSFP